MRKFLVRLGHAGIRWTCRTCGAARRDRTTRSPARQTFQKFLSRVTLANRSLAIKHPGENRLHCGQTETPK